MGGFSSEASVHGDDRQGNNGYEIQDILERYAAETHFNYTRVAHYWIGRLKIDRLRLVAGGAVSVTWIGFCEDLLSGRIAAPTSRTDFDRMFSIRLLNVLFAERRQQHASKRGWGMMATSERDILDVADPRSGESEAWIDVEDLVEYILDRLERKDPRMFEALSERMKGRTIVEIAKQLGVSRATIERVFAEIRSLLGPLFEDER